MSTPKAGDLVRELATGYADRYAERVLLPDLVRCSLSSRSSDLRESMRQPFRCLRTVLGRHLFIRRANIRPELATLCLAALDHIHRNAPEGNMFANYSGGDFARRFAEVAKDARSRVDEQDLSLAAGFYDLARDLSERQSQSIAGWIEEGVRRTGRIDALFERLVATRGCGPKLASIILRDVCFVYDLERSIAPDDLLHTFPVDKWTRLLAPFLVDEPLDQAPPDWALAGTLTKQAKIAGVSVIRLSMGVTAFGARSGLTAGQLPVAVESLARRISKARVGNHKSVER